MFSANDINEYICRVRIGMIDLLDLLLFLLVSATLKNLTSLLLSLGIVHKKNEHHNVVPRYRYLSTSYLRPIPHRGFDFGFWLDIALHFA